MATAATRPATEWQSNLMAEQPCPCGSMDDPQLTARQLDLCREKLQEIERLLGHGVLGVPDSRRRIAALATAIVRCAPHGGMADLARKVRSEAEGSSQPAPR